MSFDRLRMNGGGGLRMNGGGGLRMNGGGGLKMGGGGARLIRDSGEGRHDFVGK